MKLRQEPHQESASLSDISAEVPGELHGGLPLGTQGNRDGGQALHSSNRLCSSFQLQEMKGLGNTLEIATLVERISSHRKAQLPQKGTREDAGSGAEQRQPLSSRENYSESVGLKMCRWSGVRKLKAFPFLPAPPDQPCAGLLEPIHR